MAVLVLLTRARGWVTRTAKNPVGALIADLVIALAVGVFAVFWYLDGQQTKRALCDFRGDLQAREERSQQFLVDHPDLKEIRLGDVTLSRSQIQQQVDAQAATLRSLDKLNC